MEAIVHSNSIGQFTKDVFYWLAGSARQTVRPLVADERLSGHTPARPRPSAGAGLALAPGARFRLLAVVVRNSRRERWPARPPIFDWLTRLLSQRSLIVFDTERTSFYFY